MVPKRGSNPATRRKRKQKIVICVCGLTGCGKSTAAKRLAEKYGLKYHSGGDAIEALALKMGYEPSGREWWTSEEGTKFAEQRMENPEFDKKVDEELMELAKEENVVLDSWTMPWLLKNGFKIWLHASSEERVKRLAEKEKINRIKALDILKEKDEKSKMTYKKHYGFCLGEDFSPFNLILDTNELSADETFRVLCMVIDQLYIKKKRIS